MFSGRDVGARVSVRRTLPTGQRSDVIGELLSWDDGVLQLRSGDGEIVTVAESAVVAGRVVPPAPPRRPPGVPHVSVEDMQRIANAGWPAREVEEMGDWLLRAHGGITGRANSVMAIGDPGLPLDEALSRIKAWYAERALPPLVQLPEQSALNSELEDRGWHQLHVTIVQTASLAATLALLSERADQSRLHTAVATEPDVTWLSLMHDLDENDPEAHVEILSGPPLVGFATTFDGSRHQEAVGIGRVSIEGQWAGITSVDVAPERRRQGIGSIVMRALLEWAQDHGARAAYLQVRAKNEPALALYRQLGFVPHHPYCYRAPN